MTEQELRQMVVSVAKGWLGIKGGTPEHHTIVDIYNAHRPLARGYKLKYTDAWCAGFASAVAIDAGLTDIIPTEVGCEEHIRLFQKLGRWVEDDAYTPQPGDYIFYDWQDKGQGDNRGYSDHEGIVVSCDGTDILVIEGNKGNGVYYRPVEVNGRYIRGYGVPDYAGKARAMATTSGEADKPQEKAPWYAENWARATELGLVDGTRPEDPVTRAECVTIVLRALTAQKGEK